MKKTALALLCTTLAGCTPLSPPEDAALRETSVVIRYDQIHHPVIANAGMVVSQNRLATEIGQQVLRDGGNAIDAAVAVGFALAVTLPRAGNIGGSGFMVMHLADENQQVALDFRSSMPATFDADRYRGNDGRVNTDALKFGAHVVGVPGTVAGLHLASKRFGKLPFGELVQPAIELARSGIVVTHDLGFALAAQRDVFAQFPSSRAAYLNANGQPPQFGELWRQPDLAWTLTEIRDHGSDAFYQGAVAKMLTSAVQADGGHISMEDLARYEVRVREPLQTTYRGKRVVTMPPVSGGGVTLLQMLNTLSHFNLAELPQGSAQSLHLIAEVMKQGSANRRFGIGDPDYVPVAIKEMLSPALAREMAAAIDLKNARAVKDVQPLNPTPEPSRETTHYSVVDQWGNAVSTTYTLGYSFGSGYVAGRTGVLLDNQMRNYTFDSPGHANAPAPGKRMVSTMTPTIVLDDAGAVEIVTGTPGGSRIVNVVLQLLINMIDYEMSVAEATHASRVHQPWRTQALAVEPSTNLDTVALLRERGHQIEFQGTMGSTQTVQIKDGLMFGAADPRRPDALAKGVQQPTAR